MKPEVKRVGLIVAVVACLAVLVAIVFRERDPVYQGRSAMDWGRDLNNPNPTVQSNATLAVRALGPKAFPVWARALSRIDAPYKRPFLSFAPNVARWIRRIFSSVFKPFDAEWDRLAGARALEVLGPDAPIDLALVALKSPDLRIAGIAQASLTKIGKPAVPGLVAMLENSNPMIRSRSCLALGAIGPAAGDAVPSLIHQLPTVSTNNRSEIVFALKRIGPAAAELLLEELQSTNSRNREMASYVFACGGPFSTNVPGGLIHASRDSSTHVRLNAIQALGDLRPIAPESVAAFVVALRDPEVTVRLQALRSLARSWIRAEPAIPELVRLFDDADPEIRFHALLVIEHIGSGAKAAVPALRTRLKDDDASIRAKAASLLAKLDPDGTAEAQKGN